MKPKAEWKPPGPRATMTPERAATWPRQDAQGRLVSLNWGKPLSQRREPK